MARVLANARYWSDGLVERGLKVVRHGDLVTPIVPVLVGDDWKAGLLWKALFDAGVFVNTALHPAVPPGGALLRTSVMATHDTADARPRAGDLQRREGRDSRPSTGPCRAPRRPEPAAPTSRLPCPFLHKSGRQEKRCSLRRLRQTRALTPSRIVA